MLPGCDLSDDCVAGGTVASLSSDLKDMECQVVGMIRRMPWLLLKPLLHDSENC